MSVELPGRLGPYLLLRHLASGGMGDVYLAHEDRGVSTRLCVVKTVRGDYVGDRVAMRRFVDEARTSSLLSHPNVVAAYDVGEADGTAYIAVEYVAGRDLMAIYLAARDAGHTVPAEVTLHVIAELLDALDYVHHAVDPRSGEPLKVVHRDVSPQNVLVGFDGSVRLIDFGIARCAVRGELTRVGQLVGKLRYVSPEQARGEPVDGATDVWAACVTACELLTGQRFWGDRRAEAVASLLAAGEPVTPPGLDLLARDLQDALRAGLDPDAGRRPGTAELRDRLRALADKRGLRDAREQTRAVMEQLFLGEEERERNARAALLQEPTVVRAAALPDSAVYAELASDRADVDDEPSGTGRATLGIRPFALPNTRVLEPTPHSVALPATPASSQRRLRSTRRPTAQLAAAAVASVVVVLVGLWAANRPSDPARPTAIDAELMVPRAPLPVAAVEPTHIDVSDGPPIGAGEGSAVAAPQVAPAPEVTVDAAPSSTTRPTRKPTRIKKVEAKPRLFGDRVRALRECEPRPLCASSILRDAEDVTALSVEELRALDDSLERCLRRCR